MKEVIRRVLSLACREHYGIWLKENGLTEENLAAYFNDQFIGNWNLPRELHPSVFVAEKTCDFIMEHLNKRNDKPFFIWMSFPDPHNPHVVPAPYDTLVNPADVNLKVHRDGEFDDKPPIYRELYKKGMRGLTFSDVFGVPCANPARPDKEDVWRKSVAINNGMVKLMDEEIGKVIELLKDQGLYDRTIIIFTTDHGDYLGNHGFQGKGFPSFEEVYNVPLIMKGSGMRNRNERSNSLIGTIDLAPTILDLAGISIPKEMEGISAKELLTGKKDKIREAFIIENRLIQKGFYQKMFVTNKYKLVYYYGQSYGELYNLENDPDQYKNLWNDNRFQDLKRQLLFRLYKKNVIGKEIRNNEYTVPELLELLDKQIDKEGSVQERTSFS